MTFDIHNGHCDLPARPPAPLRLRRLLAAWLPEALLRRWWTLGCESRRRAIARHLKRLDDHTLRDLGFDRTEISMAAYDLAAKTRHSNRPRR